MPRQAQLEQNRSCAPIRQRYGDPSLCRIADHAPARVIPGGLLALVQIVQARDRLHQCRLPGPFSPTRATVSPGLMRNEMSESVDSRPPGSEARAWPVGAGGERGNAGTH